MYTLHKIQEELRSEYAYMKRMYFNEDGTLHDDMKYHLDISIKDILDEQIAFSLGFEKLSEFTLMHALYHKVYETEEFSKILFINAASYSYGLLHFFNGDCTRRYAPIVLMRKAVYLWTSLFLLGWDKEAIEVGNSLIDSLNKKGSIIKYGNRLYVESWFLIELFSLAFGKQYNKEDVDYPIDMEEYQDILDTWDTEDQIKVDLNIAKLCKLHIQIDEIDEIKYLNFHKDIMTYYPYIAIGYLAIRKQKGIKTPKTFTHPLMNTPIAKMFLDIKEPLPKPKELPYAKELLEKLKEQCPDVEIPQWLDSEDTPNTSTEIETNAQSIDTIPDDFLK